MHPEFNFEFNGASMGAETQGFASGLQPLLQ